MDSFDIVVVGALVALALFQIVLSVRVARSDMYERQQKIWQIWLIWLVPILGAGIAFHMLRDAEARSRRPGA
jgi:hypothetical protein